MKRFDYVDYKGHPYILSEINGDTVTLTGIFNYEPYENFCVTEFDAKIYEIKPNFNDYDQCILGRLRTYRMIFDNIFGFADEELARIYSFT